LKELSGQWGFECYGKKTTTLKPPTERKKLNNRLRAVQQQDRQEGANVRGKTYAEKKNLLNGVSLAGSGQDQSVTGEKNEAKK